MAIDFDFTPYFQRYEALVQQVDQVFDNMQQEFSDCVTCSRGCCDCCFALFDLSFIEALYINHRFNETHQGRSRALIIERANRADRETYRIKRKAHKAHGTGVEEADILKMVATERVRCPMLNDQDSCDPYEFRPITCRLYGIPTSINGEGHTCGLTHFKEGRSYPTANLDAIHQHLYKLSAELVADLRSKYVQMADMLIPVSMALLTDYDATYLGLPGSDEDVSPKDKENERILARRNRKEEKSRIREHVAAAAKIYTKKGV